MRRPWIIWSIAGLCLLLMFGGMGWVTAKALSLDAAAREAQTRAQLEEAIRLSLWRMDSLLAPLLSREAGRSHQFYLNETTPKTPALISSYFLANTQGLLQVWGRGGAGLRAKFERPLPNETQPGLADSLLSFSETRELEPSGELLATATTKRPSADQLLKVASLVTKKLSASPSSFRGTAQQKPAFHGSKKSKRAPPGKQRRKSRLEWGKRAQAVANTLGSDYQAYPTAWDANQQALPNAQSTNTQRIAGALGKLMPTPAPMMPVKQGPMLALWLDEELLLLRRVEIAGEAFVEGSLLDTQVLRSTLLKEITDLLPAARLVAAPSGVETEHVLATLPLQLIPGPLPEEALTGEAEGQGALRISLFIAWACVLLAAGAVLGLLFGALALSERRGTFVSSVTHELRTPLTTFRMYTEMLCEGMVAPEKQQHYLETLRRESDRLAALVENVLAYARLEGKRYAQRIETVELSALLERSRPRLRARCESAGLALVFEPSTQPQLRVRGDPQGIEQIVFNLVDNAAKYAASGAPEGARLVLSLEALPQQVRLHAVDNGPGVPLGDAKRIFRPFSKASQHEAGTAPGVGLGLALSRRLARQMGGALRLEPPAGGLGDAAGRGAHFCLTLPRVSDGGAAPSGES